MISSRVLTARFSRETAVWRFEAMNRVTDQQDCDVCCLFFLAQQLFFALLMKQQLDSRPFLGSAEAVFRMAASLLLRSTSGDQTAVEDLQPRLVASVREGLPKFNKPEWKQDIQTHFHRVVLAGGGGGGGGVYCDSNQSAALFTQRNSAFVWFMRGFKLSPIISKLK